jgi:hypothetical protein
MCWYETCPQLKQTRKWWQNTSRSASIWKIKSHVSCSYWFNELSQVDQKFCSKILWQRVVAQRTTVSGNEQSTESQKKSGDLQNGLVIICLDNATYKVILLLLSLIKLTRVSISPITHAKITVQRHLLTLVHIPNLWQEHNEQTKTQRRQSQTTFHVLVHI